MRSLAVIASLVVAVPAIAQPASHAPLSGDVLVWADAHLYLRPDVHGPSLQLVTLDAPREQRIGHAFPVHVVADHGDLVEVEPTSGYGCAWKQVSSPLAHLHLYVARADLAPVLTRRFSKRFADGSALDLAPGTPIGSLDGGPAAAVYGDAPAVPLAKAQIGESYRPRAFGKPPSDRFELEHHAQVTVDGRPIRPRGDWTGHTAVRHGKTTLLALATRCARMTVVAQSADVTRFDDSPIQAAGGAFAALEGGDRDYFPRGTKLTIAGGAATAIAGDDIDVEPPGPAAVACADVTVEARDEPPDLDLDPVTPDAARTLRVCGPAKAVRHVAGMKPW